MYTITTGNGANSTPLHGYAAALWDCRLTGSKITVGWKVFPGKDIRS